MRAIEIAPMYPAHVCVVCAPQPVATWVASEDTRTRNAESFFDDPGAIPPQRVLHHHRC